MLLLYLLFSTTQKRLARSLLTSLFYLLQSFAYFSAVQTGRDVSSLMISVHLFGGLPLSLFFLKSSFSDLFTKLS